MKILSKKDTIALLKKQLEEIKQDSSKNTLKENPTKKIKYNLPENFELTDELETTYNLMEHSNTHLFITGKAGTGKSTLLQYFRNETSKNVVEYSENEISLLSNYSF